MFVQNTVLKKRFSFISISLEIFIRSAVSTTAGDRFRRKLCVDSRISVEKKNWLIELLGNITANSVFCRYSCDRFFLIVICRLTFRTHLCFKILYALSLIHVHFHQCLVLTGHQYANIIIVCTNHRKYIWIAHKYVILKIQFANGVARVDRGVVPFLERSQKSLLGPIYEQTQAYF